jgi:uncharacterized protein
MNAAMQNEIASIKDKEDLLMISKSGEHDKGILFSTIEYMQKAGMVGFEKGRAPNFDHLSTWKSSSQPNISIFLTTKCNLQCRYCYANGGDLGVTINRRVWQTAIDYFFSFIKQSNLENIEKVKLFFHGGGEPTVAFSELKEITDYFSEKTVEIGKKPDIHIMSNGAYADNVCQWILDQNINIGFSFDGVPHVQNKYRPFRSGDPSYDVVVNNMKILIAAGRKVSIRATVMRESVNEMKKAVQLAKEIGLTRVHFEPVAITGRCGSHKIYRPGIKSFVDNFLESYLCGIDLGIDVNYSGARCFSRPTNRFCSASGENFGVTPNGDVSTCFEVLNSQDPASETFFIGKVEPDLNTVVFDTNRITALEHRVAQNLEVCNGCFMQYHCAGNCLVRGYRESDGHLDLPDTYRCKITKEINKMLIVWMAEGKIGSREFPAMEIFESSTER